MRRKSKTTDISKMERTIKSFAGLRASLFDEFDKLRNGITDPTVANAVARMASEITKSAIAEINALKVQIRLGDEERAKVKAITDGTDAK